MKKTHDLGLEIFDKRVADVLKRDLDLYGISWDSSFNDYTRYDYIIIELECPLLNVILKDLSNAYLLYYALMDVFIEDFKARDAIQNQFVKDLLVLFEKMDALCS